MSKDIFWAAVMIMGLFWFIGFAKEQAIDYHIRAALSAKEK